MADETEDEGAVAAHGDYTPGEIKDAQRQARQRVAHMRRGFEKDMRRLFDALLRKQGDELFVHAMDGRGFRIHVEVTLPDGSPFVAPAAEAPAEAEAPRVKVWQPGDPQ